LGDWFTIEDLNHAFNSCFELNYIASTNFVLILFFEFQEVFNIDVKMINLISDFTFGYVTNE